MNIDWITTFIGIIILVVWVLVWLFRQIKLYNLEVRKQKEEEAKLDQNEIMWDKSTSWGRLLQCQSCHNIISQYYWGGWDGDKVQRRNDSSMKELRDEILICRKCGTDKPYIQKVGQQTRTVTRGGKIDIKVKIKEEVACWPKYRK